MCCRTFLPFLQQLSDETQITYNALLTSRNNSKNKQSVKQPPREAWIQEKKRRVAGERFLIQLKKIRTNFVGFLASTSEVWPINLKIRTKRGDQYLIWKRLRGITGKNCFMVRFGLDLRMFSYQLQEDMI